MPLLSNSAIRRSRDLSNLARVKEIGVFGGRSAGTVKVPSTSVLLRREVKLSCSGSGFPSAFARFLTFFTAFTAFFKVLNFIHHNLLSTRKTVKRRRKNRMGFRWKTLYKLTVALPLYAVLEQPDHILRSYSLILKKRNATNCIVRLRHRIGVKF
jgi:hypothetical protein